VRRIGIRPWLLRRGGRTPMRSRVTRSPRSTVLLVPQFLPCVKKVTSEIRRIEEELIELEADTGELRPKSIDQKAHTMPPLATILDIAVMLAVIVGYRTIIIVTGRRRNTRAAARTSTAANR